MKKRATSDGNPWEKTQVQCLLRNRHSGRYYGRFKVSGKQKWVALDTDVFTVAKIRLTEEATKFQKIRGSFSDVSSGKAMMAELVEMYRQQTESDSDIRSSTKTARYTSIKKVLKTWPGLEDLEPSQVTVAGVHKWVSRFKQDGTRFVAPGTKTLRKGNSASSVNRAIDTLKAILNIAVQNGQIHSNPVLVQPATGRLKKKVEQKKLILPSRAEVTALLVGMRAIPGWGQEAALLCRFLKMSGARIGEIPRTTWRKVGWDRKQIHLPGYKTETSDRIIPLFPALEELLKEITEFRKRVSATRSDKKTFLDPDDAIFRIQECQKTIDTAAKAANVTRITHHDFRHLFATAVIESGVDIPTLSRWLGHSDGGVLAMKTYGHLRLEHSQMSAQKVVF